MSTSSIVWIPLILLSYPILIVICRRYVNLVNCFEYSSSDQSSPASISTWTGRLLYDLRPRALIWSYPIVLIHLQSGTVSVLGQFFLRPHLIISSPPLQKVRKVNCWNFPYLTILSHYHLSQERTRTMSIILRLFIWLFHTILSRT